VKSTQPWDNAKGPNPKSIAPWDVKGYKVKDGPFTPGGAMAAVGGNAMVSKQTNLNYPAQRNILSCIYEGMQVPIDAAEAFAGQADGLGRDDAHGTQCRCVRASVKAATSCTICEASRSAPNALLTLAQIDTLCAYRSVCALTCKPYCCANGLLIR